MSFFTDTTAKYSVLDLGFGLNLVKEGIQPTPPEMVNVFTGGNASRNIIAGELISDVFQKSGTLFNGKTAFDNTQTGYILGVDSSDSLVKFYIGNTTSYLNWTGSALNIAGALTATTIDIGGSDATSFHVDIDGNMWLGAATFAGAVASISNAGAGTFSNITITGGSISSTPISSIPNSTATDISLLEFSHNLVFSVTDADTIAWAAGTIVLSNGRTFSIDAGNTGNMVALTYIYLDAAVSSTVLQTTTTYSTAMGANKMLLGMARNNTVTASFIPRGGGQPLIDGGNIGALSIVAGNIAASTITSDKISVSQLSAISADIGSVTAGTITGTTIRTSASDPRIELTSSQMIMTNALGVSLISFIPSSGAIAFAHATISRDGVPLTIQNSTDSASVQVAQFGSGTRAIPADNDNGYIGFNCTNDLGASVEFARMYWGALDVTSTTKDSTFTFHTYANNVLSERFDIHDTGVQVTGDLEVTGSILAPSISTSITTSSVSFSLLNATATEINFAGASECIVNFGGGTLASQFRFLEPSGGGTNYTGFKAGAATASVVYTLPLADGSNGFFLQTNGSAVLSWSRALALASADYVTIGGGATASELRFLEPSGSGTNYSAFKAVAQAANITYSLPPTVGAAGTFLKDVAGDGVLTWVSTIKLIVSDTLLSSADTQRASTTTTPLKKKEIALTGTQGALRIKFDLATTFNGTAAYGQIYRNGSAVGTQRSKSTDQGVFTTYSEDISSWADGDLFQLYHWGDGDGTLGQIKNFRIYGDLYYFTVNTD